MHPEAYEAVRSALVKVQPQPGCSVLDVGGRDVNGTPRALFPDDVRYVVLDVREAPGVDIVADACDWLPSEEFDVVLSTEVFEHLDWRPALANMVKATRSGGWVIVTAAKEPRLPHSAIDGCEVREGEHYANVDPLDLLREMVDHRLGSIVISGSVIEGHGGDVYAYGRKP
jgi:hypothetical protein